MNLVKDRSSVVRGDELLIERVFDAPRELVFRVWTTREHLMRWWGPKDFTTVEYELDLREGGAYRAVIRAPDGSEHGMSGIYREIVAPERIVMTFGWDSDRALGVENLVTVTFHEMGGRTWVSFHQAPFASQAQRDSHHGGWSELLDRMAAYLSQETEVRS